MARRHHGLRIARDLLRFALENKRWWLIPAFVACLVRVGVVALSASPLGPFVYTLF